MSDGEDDYMSDKFLAGLPDVRPSLVHNHAKKRQIQMKHKHREHNKKQKEIYASTSATVDNDKLQMALSKPLESENKGFKLLAKMGYKPGQALGKPVDTNKETVSQDFRLIEPIGITIKSDRQGLGREAALKELMEKRREIRMARLRREAGENDKTSIEEFRKRTTQKAEEKFVANAIRRCQKTCENLDLASDVDTPAMPWFWPERLQPETDENGADNDESEKQNKIDENKDEEMEEEFSNIEKLEMLTNYVRTSYNFCYWCGVRYENAQDLMDNCPGLTKDDH